MTMDATQISDRGRRAVELLESDVFKEAVEAVERLEYNEMLTLAHDDDAGRRDKVHAIRAIRAVKNMLVLFAQQARNTNKPERKVP